jgi:hypothetical protein
VVCCITYLNLPRPSSASCPLLRSARPSYSRWRLDCTPTCCAIGCASACRRVQQVPMCSLYPAGVQQRVELQQQHPAQQILVHTTGAACTGAASTRCSHTASGCGGGGRYAGGPLHMTQHSGYAESVQHATCQHLVISHCRRRRCCCCHACCCTGTIVNTNTYVSGGTASSVQRCYVPRLSTAASWADGQRAAATWADRHRPLVPRWGQTLKGWRCRSSCSCSCWRSPGHHLHSCWHPWY